MAWLTCLQYQQEEMLFGESLQTKHFLQSVPLFFPQKPKLVYMRVHPQESF